MPEAARKILAGARVRRLRRELGLSQSGMAAELGISASYLNLMERNQRPVTAQVLIRLAEAFNVDPRGFAREEEARLQSELDEVFSDPLFRSQPVARDELRELADLAPSVADAVQRLYAAYRDMKEGGAGLSNLEDDERGEGPRGSNPVDRVRDLIQSAANHFAEIEAHAETLADEMQNTGSDLLSALSARLKEKHGIRVQILPVDVMPASLRRFDHHRRRLMLSELVDASGRIFQTAYQLALIEWREVIDAIATRLEPEQGASQALLRVSLANYAAAAVMMPYQKFLDAAEALNYDIDVLGARFQASFEQVAHRLTTLNRPNARGVPFFLIRIDNAGNVSKRFAAGNFPFSRFGGTCPLWSLHETFSSPGAFMTEIVELPDGGKWFSIARTVRRAASTYGGTEGQFAIGLGCELKYAARLVYARKFDVKSAPATQIGVNCRLCERDNCAQRAAPPITRKLRVDESVRGVSPFSFDR
jgi:predicted transcriptional regulator/DNA-binding XRE family transcriptional regulator